MIFGEIGLRGSHPPALAASLDPAYSSGQSFCFSIIFSIIDNIIKGCRTCQVICFQL
jgi:hypothetical protein